MSSSSHSTPATAPKAQRVLACLLCQSRKVRCDRTFPCANCVKAGAKCIPAGTITKQRRKRFPERELLDRLHRYESLLRQNKIDFEPLHPNGDSERSNPVTEGISSFQAIDIAESVENPGAPDVEHPSSSKTINVWHAMNQRVYEEETDVEDDSNEYKVERGIRQQSVRKALAHLFEDDDDTRFNFGARPDIDPITLHPTQVDIIRIWQIYLDNVNPVLKVTHTPTLQTRIIEAATNLAIVTDTMQALMFGIYCVAMLTLSDEDCLYLFGSKCGDLLKQFQLGCRQALLRCGILRTNDRDCLTAFYLYLLSTKPKAEPRALSTNVGIAIRLAQHMDLHSESMNAKHTALEAEMRRRLWWALVLLDSRVSETSDFKCTILAPGWDCKPPSNITDFDLATESKIPPAKHDMITEATFTVVRCELANFVRYSGFWLDFMNPCLKPLARRFPPGSLPNGDELGILDKMVEERYLRYCNPDNPLHFMTIWMARSFLAKNRLFAHYARHARAAADQSEADRDLALGHAVRLLECDAKLLTSPLTKMFAWFSMTVLQFPFMAYIHVVQDLHKRPTGIIARRAWTVISENYAVRFTNWIGNDNPLANIISGVVLQAWAARKEALPSENEYVHFKSF
ncbi:hypothetical protein BU23DRAFT_463415 [Bimuria novae-zelandiae CBS 107.79]|uniref:Zn(2)-C6 fungal-type domain-containing protein n=1 Tax=Bimuria novae-zelandiae CBS 107.79 TaxID=1447943 RepID=A0A6A5VC66_9PLEO|nr:hypothetical protein BU23DRAFT_463415 [Bimuria novae-zelandiae CBS 107.79]